MRADIIFNLKDIGESNVQRREARVRWSYGDDSDVQPSALVRWWIRWCTETADWSTIQTVVDTNLSDTSGTTIVVRHRSDICDCDCDCDCDIINSTASDCDIDICDCDIINSINVSAGSDRLGAFVL